MTDFFISHSSADDHWGNWIGSVLIEAGYRVILDQWDFRPGENWMYRIDRAVREAERTVAVLSKNYLAAQYTPIEWYAALGADPLGIKPKLIPVRVDNFKPEGLLGMIVYIDLVGLSEVDAREALLSGLTHRSKPRHSSFPGATRKAFPGGPSSENLVGTLRAYKGSGDSDFSQASLPQTERLQIVKTLSQLTPAQLNLLLSVIDPPAGTVPLMPTPQDLRLFELQKWAEGPRGCGLLLLGRLAEALQKSTSAEPNARRPVRQVPIPPPPSLFFTGREDILAALREKLDRTGRTVLTGMGGIGKTQTAVAYVHRYLDSYREVLWVGAGTESLLTEGFSKISGDLGLPEAESQNQVVAAGAVRRWLELHDHWLLILDNVEDPAVPQSHLPLVHQGHLLVTTQHSWISQFPAIPVNPLTDKEGALLLSRCILGEDIVSLDDVPPEVRDLTLQISAIMAGHPLALDQAGAYMRDTGTSPASYLAKLKESDTNLRILLSDRGGPTLDHPLSVEATFAISFERLESTDQTAADLLRACSFLHADDVPVEIFLEASSELDLSLASMGSLELGLDTAVRHAARYSLLRQDGGNRVLRMLRLTQTIMRARLSATERAQWQQRVINALTRVFPDEISTDWQPFERLFPHVLNCARWLKDEAVHIHQAGTLFHRAGRYAHERARLREAEELLALSLRALQVSEEPDQSAIARVSRDLARLFELQGHYEEAMRMGKKALEIFSSQLGQSHPEVADTLEVLAWLHENRGEYQQSETLLRKALILFEEALGSDAWQTGYTLNHLGKLAYRLGYFSEAEERYRESLAIARDSTIPHRRRKAETLNNLGLLYYELGRLDEAESLLLQALDLWRGPGDRRHPDAGLALCNLGLIREQQGQLEAAEESYNDAIHLWETSLGLRHPYVAAGYSNLGQLLVARGSLERAERLLNEALSINQKTFGREHPDTAVNLNNLALVQQKRSPREEVADLYQEAIRIWDKALGRKNLNTAQALQNLGILYLQLEAPLKALPLLEESFEIRQSLLGSEHPAVEQAMELLEWVQAAVDGKGPEYHAPA